MATRKGKTVVLNLPVARTLQSASVLQDKTLVKMLETILRSPAAGKGLTSVILKGGEVKARDPSQGSWTKTVWRRSGPIRPGEPLVRPADLTMKLRRNTRTRSR